jgi:hypothetical protein
MFQMTVFLHGGDSPAGGILGGIAPGHITGAVMALLAPAAVWAFLAWMRDRSAAGHRRAAGFVERYEKSTPTTRIVALLLVLSGAIHLGMLPDHWDQARGTAVMFGLDGLLLVAAALAVFYVRRWRLPTAALLVAGLIAYMIFIGSGKEAPDQLGLFSKLAEITALGLLMLPSRSSVRRWRRRIRWSAAALGVVFLTNCTGSVAWVAQFTEKGPDNHNVAGAQVQAVAAGPATAEQKAAADRLVADTAAGIARYQDVRVAEADGYKGDGFGASTSHYTNQRYVDLDTGLDPRRPAALVYANTKHHGKVLLGAMYEMKNVGEKAPDPGGPITSWHAHNNICVGLPFFFTFVTPFGSCPAISITIKTPYMMHVWTAPNPNGPYGDLDEAWAARLVNSK